MNAIKNLMSLAALVCAGAVSLTPGEASGGSSVAGSNCHVFNYQFSTPPPYLRHPNAVSHGNYDPSAPLLGVTCLLPTENTLGTTVNFRMRVSDYSDAAGVTCYGVAYNQDGNTVATTTAATTSAADQGGFTLTKSLSVNPQSSSYTYGVNCTLPGNQSAIFGVRIY